MTIRTPMQNIIFRITACSRSKWSLLIVVLSAALLARPCFSQVNIRLRNASYTIPVFNDDSVQSFRNIFTVAKTLKPIAASDALIEVRMYLTDLPVALLRGHIDVLRIFPDTVTFSKFRFRQLVDVAADPTTLLPGLEHKIEEKFKKEITYKDIIYNSNSAALIDRLVKIGLFTIKDQRQLLDSLNHAGTQVNDPCAGWLDCYSNTLVYFEIKAGSHVRNFKLLAMDYFRLNKTISAFKTQHDIMEFINEVFFD